MVINSITFPFEFFYGLSSPFFNPPFFDRMCFLTLPFCKIVAAGFSLRFIRPSSPQPKGCGYMNNHRIEKY